MMQNRERRYGAALSYANIILRNLTYIFYTPFLLRFLGQSQYGIYQMTTQVVNSLSLLSMGFAGAYVRFFWKFSLNSHSENERKKNISHLNGLSMVIFGTVSFLALFLGIILSSNVDVFFGKTFSHSELHLAYLLMMLLTLNIAINFPSTVFDSFIMANQRFIFQQSRAIASTVIQPVLVIPMLFLGANAVAVVAVQTIVTVVFLIINAHFAIKKLHMVFAISKKIFSLFKEIIVFSGFLFINEIVDLINNNFPSFIVGSLMGAKQISLYSIAFQIRNIFFQISLALSNVFIPRVNQMVNGGSSNFELTKLMTKVGRIQILLLSFIYGGFIVVGQTFIRVWAGKNFSVSYWMIVIMIFPVLIPLCQNVGIEIQRAKNMHHFRSITLGVLALTNILITIFAIRWIGIYGSILGYIFSIVIGNGLLMNWFNQKKVGLSMTYFWKNIANIGIPFFSSVILVVFLKSIIHLNTLSGFFFFGLLYSCVYIVMWYLFSANNYEKGFLIKALKLDKPKFFRQ